MWNPFKLRSAEARRLELRIVEVEDELGKLVRLLERIDARQRGRKQSAPDSARGGERDPSADTVDRAPSRVVADSPALTKEQLRAFARERGLIS